MKNLNTLIRIACMFCIAFLLWSSCTLKEKKLSPEQETTLYYLYDKSLISDTFVRMLYKVPIDFRGIDMEKQLLYFIFKSKHNRAEIIQKIALDTNAIEFAPCTTGMCEFGGLRGDITGHTAFRMPVTNLRVDPSMAIETKMPNVKKMVSLKDLIALRDTQKYIGTHYQIAIPKNKFGIHYAANIGAFITKKDKDPLIKSIVNDISPNEKTKELIAQKLLDIVTNEITYSFADHWYRREITKRAHEVMLSGMGDCSAKTTLYASLLEQCNIPYCLLYYENHVNVGVLGNFPSITQYTYKIKDKTYHIAETTIKDFKIGKTRMEENDIFKNIIFYQVPSESEVIINVADSKPLDWFEMPVDE